MKNELYELYKQCFPTKQLDKETFLKKIDYDHSEVIMEEEHCHMVGASVISGNDILMLCVNPEMQKKGYGKKLLMRSEEIMANSGYHEAVLGKGFHDLLGRFTSDEIPAGKQFFQKHGFKECTEDHGYWCISKEIHPTYTYIEE